MCHHHNHHNHRHNNFLLGMLVGGSLGAISIIMLKSKEGKDFQKKVSEKYEDLKKEFNEYISKDEKKSKRK
jgi:gas vesicle protein